MFIDRVTIKVAGGHGGKGCISFRREKYVPRGGPDGGDGGHGGSVIVCASHDKQSLVDLYYMPHYEGGNGKHGRGKKQHGARGDDVRVDVPVGTVVYDADSEQVLADLVKDGQQFVAARGGRGGTGNTRFATAQNRAPRIAGDPEPGEERTLRLELKTVADVGLVGFPNAGKSTLISTISDAHPKTAPYPFTTLRPNIGIVELSDFFRFSIADVPGLIEGAHRNVGLGHDFLRHIERCRVLVYVLDCAGVDGRDPVHDFQALQNELELHKEGLSRREAVIAANKMDVPGAAESLQTLQDRAGDLPIFPITATEKASLTELVRDLQRRLESQRKTSATQSHADDTADAAT